MAAADEPDGLEQAPRLRRRSPDLPPEFAPLAPLGGATPGGPARRAPDGPPRLRLTAAASRRRAPDSTQAVPTVGVPGSAMFTPAPAPAAQSSVEALSQEPAPASPRFRRAAPVVGALVVLLVVVGAAVLLRPVERTVSADEAVPVAPREGPPGGEYAPPVTLPADSEYVETAVLDGDDLVVTHWISTTTPMDRVRLRPPSSPVLAGVDVAVEDLVVAADGVRLDSGAASVDVPAALPSAGLLYVRYRLPDALERTSSVDDRALATVTSLDVGLEGRSLPRTQAFPGGRVMTLACLAQGARAVPQPCGTYVEGAWQVRSPADEVPVAVVAQFDLAVDR